MIIMIQKEYAACIEIDILYTHENEVMAAWKNVK